MTTHSPSPTEPAEPIDHRTVDWRRVRRAAYRVRQELTYEYPGPVADLRQRLILFPPEEHGNQRHLDWALDVDPEAQRREERDVFGNRVVHLYAPRIDRRITFTASLALEREAGALTPTVPAVWAERFLQATPLTSPDARLRAAAAKLAVSFDSADSEQVAARITAWVFANVRYAKNLTSVKTTAAEAFSTTRAGVCQDFAHIMLALCRRCGIPARYVSGHLLGEGATHAWVEVLCPHPTDPDLLCAQAFDPTHGRRCGLNYITVATGRDYLDVAPTTGSFTAPYGGLLTARKQALVTAVEYAA